MATYDKVSRLLTAATGTLAGASRAFDYAKPNKTKIPQDPMEALTSAIANYNKAKTGLGVAPAAPGAGASPADARAYQRNKRAYDAAAAELDTTAAVIRGFARNMAQATLEGMKGYTSGVSNQVKREVNGRRKFGFVPRPNAVAVGDNLEDVTDKIAQAKAYVSSIKAMVSVDADLKTGSEEYIKSVETDLDNLGIHMDRAETRHERTVDTKASRESDKNWEKHMKRLEKNARRGWI